MGTITITPTATQGYQSSTATSTLFVGNTANVGTGYAVRYTLKPTKSVKSLSISITGGSNYGLTSNNVKILAGTTSTNSTARPGSGAECTIGGTEGSPSEATLNVTFSAPIAANETVYLWLWTTSNQTAYFAIDPIGQYWSAATVTITGEEAAPSVHVKVGGTWKPCVGVYVKVNGSWKEAAEVDARVGGVWKKADQ